MQLKPYIYRAAVHYGNEAIPKCGKIDAYSWAQAESEVVDMLMKYGSTDLTDFVLTPLEDGSCDCPLVKCECKKCYAFPKEEVVREYEN